MAENRSIGAAPVFNPDKDVVVKTFEDLFDRVMDAMETNQNPAMKIVTINSIWKKEAAALMKLFQDETWRHPMNLHQKAVWY